MNNIYRKLNDIQFDEVIEEETMTEVEQQQYFNQFKMKNKQKQPSKMKKRTIQIAAAAMLLAGGLPFMNHDIQANTVKMIENITYSFKDIITPQAEKYATHINETISLSKADVKLTDVFINDKYLTYNLLVDAKGKDNALHIADPLSVKINGREMMEGLSGSSEYLKEKKVHSDIGIIHLREIPPQGKLNVEMTFGSYEGNGKNFGYKFKVNTSELNKKVKSKMMNETVLVGKEKVDVQQVSINPLSAHIKLSTSNEFNYDINLYDENGKKYYFNLISRHEESDEYQSALVFNQDIDSTGKIDDLYKAKSLDFEIIDNGKTHNGQNNVKNKTNKKALHVEF